MKATEDRRGSLRAAVKEGEGDFGQNDPGSISEEASRDQTEVKTSSMSVSDGCHLGRGNLKFKGWG